MNLKYQLQYGMENFNYLMESYSQKDNQDYFEYILKKHGEKRLILR